MPYHAVQLSHTTWVVWWTGSTSKKIIKLYQEFVIRHYGNSIIVLAGCKNAASNKRTWTS